MGTRTLACLKGPSLLRRGLKLKCFPFEGIIQVRSISGKSLTKIGTTIIPQMGPALSPWLSTCSIYLCQTEKGPWSLILLVAQCHEYALWCIKTSVHQRQYYLLDCQWLFRTSGWGLSHLLPPNLFSWRCWRLDLGLSPCSTTEQQPLPNSLIQSPFPGLEVASHLKTCTAKRGRGQKYEQIIFLKNCCPCS